MDKAHTGPMWLKDPRVADTVVETLIIGEREWKLYQLLASVIMANHVHVLIRPHKRLREITRAVKNHGARRANVILGRTGQPFSQPESYDHWVRDSKEFDRIVGLH